jgi:short subunit dehydrogenase-like uncharacterized protein
MSGAILVYGATGFTGRLVATAAKARGLSPILAARNEQKLRAAALELQLAARVARLDSAASVDAILDGVAVVLNAAGPFAATVDPLVQACLRAGVHYLDLSAERAAIEGARRYDAQARAAGVMVMPGVGFDVVPSDCLAAHLAARCQRGRWLRIGIAGLELMSRGSARTIIEQFGKAVEVRRAGEVVGVSPGSLERGFDFGGGRQACVAVSWGDVASAFYTTGIPNVEVYFQATWAVRASLLARRLWAPVADRPLWKAWWQGHVDLLPEGPSAEQRRDRQVVIAAEIEDDQGRTVSARLRTPEGYTMTAATAPDIARRVLGGDFEPGFQTPARVYGPDLVLSFPGVAREDLS